MQHFLLVITQCNGFLKTGSIEHTHVRLHVAGIQEYKEFSSHNLGPTFLFNICSDCCYSGKLNIPWILEWQQHLTVHVYGKVHYIPKKPLWGWPEDHVVLRQYCNKTCCLSLFATTHI